MPVKNKPFSAMRLTLEVVKVNPDGSEGESRAVEVNSWLKQWVELLSTMFEVNSASGGGSTASVLDTSDVSQTMESAGPGVDSEGPRCDAAAGDETFGIQVGLTNTAVDRDDNSLAGLIAEGTGLNQLNYLIQVFSTVLAITDGYRISLSRQVDNNSALTVTVEEIGLALLHRIPGPATANFLVLRDLVTEAIPASESRIFRYHMDWIE